jgi:hypothetical protein
VTIARFPYVEVDPSLGAVSAMPYLPLRLIHNQQEVQVSALVDSGATLNVLPYTLVRPAEIRVTSENELRGGMALTRTTTRPIPPCSPTKIYYTPFPLPEFGTAPTMPHADEIEVGLLRARRAPACIVVLDSPADVWPAVFPAELTESTRRPVNQFLCSSSALFSPF